MRWSLFILVFQLFTSCHSHPIFAQKSTVCSFNAELFGDPLLSLYGGSDSWSGKGDLYCFAVDGESIHRKINVCLSAWMSNQSLFTKAPSIQLSNAILLVNNPFELMTSMEVLTLKNNSTHRTANSPKYKMLGWPFVEDYSFYLNKDLDPTVAEHLKHGTLVVEPNDSSTHCGQINYQ